MSPGSRGPVIIDTGVFGARWFTGTVSGGRRIFYHPGDQAGFRSLNAWFPDDDVRLAVLSNDGTARLDPIVRDLIRTAFPALTRAAQQP